MIEKQKLIAQVSKKAKISIQKATKAYECILKENPSFRKQSAKTVKAIEQVAVAVPGKTRVKSVKVKAEKAVKSTAKHEIIKKVEVIKEVIVPVVKEVQVIKEIEVIKEVPVIVEKAKIKEVKVVKKVPYEVIKEVTLIKEVKVPVVNTKEVNKWKKKAEDLEKQYKAVAGKLTAANKALKVKAKVVVKKEQVKVVDKEGIKKWEKKYAALNKQTKGLSKKLGDAQKALKVKPKVIVKKEQVKIVDKAGIKKWEKKYATLNKQAKGLSKKLAIANKALKVKPKTITKEVIKEVPVEVIREVEVVKGIDFNALQKMMGNLGTKTISKTVVGETRTKRAAKVVNRRVITSGSKSTAEKAGSKKTSSKAKKKVTTKSKKTDDLTKIEGVGPAISKILVEAGYNSYSKVAKAKYINLKKLLMKAGPSFSIHDPETWSRQAKLASAGKWKELKKLQDKLDGGRK